MTENIVKNFYDQDLSILHSVIGMDIRSIHFERGAISLGKQQVLTGNGDLLITFFDKEKNESKIISFLPKGSESIGGDLYGFEFSQKNNTYFSQILFPESFKLEEFTFYGDDQEVETIDQNLISWAFKDVIQKPDKVVVQKKTMECIHFKISGYRNCYLYSGGEREFLMYIDFPLDHDAWLVLQVDSFKAMEKGFKELKRIS